MKVLSKLKPMKVNWWFVGYLAMALGIRFINFKEAAYLIFDVGRDLIVLREMSLGDLKLIGQTTGLPGLFYGPLWYYVGLPGYILTNGNPYGVQMWYVLVVSITAIPLFWVLSHKLLGNNRWAKLAALMLALIPGGIAGTNFVWNVMLSVPLMAGAIYCLIQARDSKIMLYSGFLLLALTLQAEFAYGVFFVATMWWLIPWMRKKWEWKTMLVAGVMILITLIPQGLFEITHGFPMTRALISGVSMNNNSVSYGYLWQQRPQQLMTATKAFFVRSDVGANYLWIGIGVLWLVALVVITKGHNYIWKLVVVVALIPYVYFMLWRGNYGYFFEYYITPHFIPLVLLLVLGMKKLFELTKRDEGKWLIGGGIWVVVGLLSWNSYVHLRAVILAPENNAGLRAMEKSVETMFGWAKSDAIDQPVFRIYAPNMSTENYDYLVWWYAKQKSLTNPLTVQDESDQIRYILYEPDWQTREDRFLPWYQEATEGMVRTRNEKVGVLTVESWMQSEAAKLGDMEER